MSKHFVEERDVAGYNCAAEVAGHGGWRYYACGKQAKTTRCGAPLCGTHARVFDRNHKLRVTKDYGNENGLICMERPEHGTARFRVTQFQAFGKPYLERLVWEDGGAWEAANPDEGAVLREFIERMKAYREQQSAAVAKASDEICDAQVRLDELEKKRPG